MKNVETNAGVGIAGARPVFVIRPSQLGPRDAAAALNCRGGKCCRSKPRCKNCPARKKKRDSKSCS
ncbi:hypothetical protein G7087_14785 [Rubrivivax benzoatilyticus]|uniref:Uncharacterized protein n=1 Tax=Rubrivivax benzoatilyticus TaxID=316997 RepID=A0ABX0HXB9_9BURK|nr:hypothetical protein [Rubrivivax benzoatilyticus]NHK99650.1 hypothetical protein [Rubrivivax benzoatilyticus]